MKELLRRTISYAFLGIFLSYFTGTTMFVHSHIVGGCTIVHSHFYNGGKSSDGTAGHEHTPAGITLISHLSSFDKTADAPYTDIPQKPVLAEVKTVYFYYLHDTFRQQSSASLRAPPAVLA